MADATDNFNRANGGLGANWTQSPSLGALAITSNQVTGPSSTAGAAWWNADAFNDDQYSQITLSDLVDDAPEVIVRHQASESDFYSAQVQVGNQQVAYRRWNDGTPTQIGTSGGGSAPWVDGDTVRLEVTGTSLQAFRNGAAIGSPVTDSTYTSGAPGFYVLDNQDKVDDWIGGPIAAGNVDGAFASTGVATAAFVGTALVDGVFASAGVATVTFNADGTFTAAGVAAAAFVGSLLVDGVWASAGVAAVTFVGLSDGVWSSAGVATVLFSSLIPVDGGMLALAEAQCLFVGEVGFRWTPEAPVTNTWTPEGVAV